MPKMRVEPTDYILVIDDDTTIGELIAEVLTDEGYIVLSAESGAQALSAITAHPPMLCLIDSRMPDMNGLEVIEHLWEHGFVDLPIVGMTASPQDAELMRTAGFACLDKPFDLDALLACVTCYVSLQPISLAVCA
jgi:CheY-like chemotaxis protein